MKDEALATLLDAQNADGGWGAVKGRRSNTESTSLAVMALRPFGDGTIAPKAARGLNWLTERQNGDGSWPLNDVAKGGSWTTALAVLTLANVPGQERRASDGAQWALTQEGSRLGWLNSFLLAISRQRQSVSLNPDLKGWGWTARAFSWVEPTSYFLLALKKLRPSLSGAKLEERIRQGEMLIYDRMCEGGGWNYGNSKVLGETLWPYPDVTALALIALQDHQGIEPNSASVRTLQKMLKEVDSGLALGLGVLCLSLYGYDVSKTKEALVRSFETTKFLSEVKTISLALLALSESHDFFRV